MKLAAHALRAYSKCEGAEGAKGDGSEPKGGEAAQQPEARAAHPYPAKQPQAPHRPMPSTQPPLQPPMRQAMQQPARGEQPEREESPPAKAAAVDVMKPMVSKAPCVARVWGDALDRAGARSRGSMA